jgi:hypothetical protein
MANGPRDFITPDEFDLKLSELRNIAERLRSYNHKTPSKVVVGDHKTALEIYHQLKENLSIIKGDDSLDGLVKDIDNELGSRKLF